MGHVDLDARRGNKTTRHFGWSTRWKVFGSRTIDRERERRQKKILKFLFVFYLEAKARIWPWVSDMVLHIRGCPYSLESGWSRSSSSRLGGNPKANGRFLKSIPIQILPPGDNICGRSSYDSPLWCLQGGLPYSADLEARRLERWSIF